MDGQALGRQNMETDEVGFVGVQRVSLAGWCDDGCLRVCSQ
jgi:hypothetical protein